MAKPQVLIVDDNPANISALKVALDPLDIKILIANSGNEALGILINQEVAAVLLDVQMPDMDGFEVATLMMMYENTKYIPIVFITAFDKDDKYLFKGYEVGAVDYIFKPFDANVIRSKVSVFLKLYSQKSELARQKNELQSVLSEKNKLIQYIENQNEKKDQLLEENIEQKKKLKNYFRFKLWATAGALTFLIALAITYNIYMSRKNFQLLAYTKELNELNGYTKKLNEAYKRFIPYDILNLLNKKSIIDVNLGDQVLKEMIVVFVDVRGYSTIAENLTPQENIALTNKLLQIMQNPIIEHQGIVNKYLGDGVMALFNNNPDQALEASIEILKNLAVFSQKRIGEEKAPIRVGIGLDSGEMIVGTVGTEDRMEQTVVADAVNVASRIEGMTKIYGASLLISENIYRKLKNPSKFTIRFMDTVIVKGRKKPVIIYQVFDGECSATIELYKKTMKDFSEGILLFREKKFAEALHSFNKVLEGNQDDQVARNYCARCIKYMHNPIDEEWSHIQILETK